MSKNRITWILLALLAIVHAQLWFGRGSVPNISHLRLQLEELKKQNEQAHLANERLASQVSDLKEGLEIVEEKARSEIGMVKPHEIYVQVKP